MIFGIEHGFKVSRVNKTSVHFFSQFIDFIENGVRVHFVDFGNEEVVSTNRLSACPDNLRDLPWQSVQIKLANIKLTDDERYSLLRDFETDQLEMKILSKNQDVYSVELTNNGKSLTEHMLELRKKNEQGSQVKTTNNQVVELVQQPVPKVVTPPPPPPVTKIEAPPRTLPEGIVFLF